MESFREFGFLMQIKASEYERNEKKKKSGYFYGAFISIFSHESAFRLVFRPHTKPVNPLTETLG